MLKTLLSVAIIYTFSATFALAGTLTWVEPMYYTDGSMIFPADQDEIIYIPYTGNSPSGPWIPLQATGPGVLSATVPDPEAGTTMWYTVSASLYGVESDKAAAVSKTVPFPPPQVLIPDAPSGLIVQ